MTEGRPARLRPPGPLSVPLAALAAFLAVLALLSFQMGAGRDPALKSSAPIARAAPAEIVKRRVIVRRVIVRPARRTDEGSPGVVVSAPASPPASVVTTAPPTAPSPPPVTRAS